MSLGHFEGIVQGGGRMESDEQMFLLKNLVQLYFAQQMAGLSESATTDVRQNTLLKGSIDASGEGFRGWLTSVAGEQAVREYLADDKHTQAAIESFADFDAIIGAFQTYQKKHYH